MTQPGLFAEAVLETKKLFFCPQTVLRIVVLGIWDYIENKIEVRTRSSPSHQPTHPGAGRLHCPAHPFLQGTPPQSCQPHRRCGWGGGREGVTWASFQPQDTLRNS